MGTNAPAQKAENLVEHQLIQSVLKVSLTEVKSGPSGSQLTYLREIARDLKDAGKPLCFTFEDIFEIIKEKITLMGQSRDEKYSLLYLGKCYQYTTDEVNFNNIPDAKKYLPEFRNELVKDGSLIFRCPELFEFDTSSGQSVLSYIVTTFLDDNGYLPFFYKVVDGLSVEEIEKGFQLPIIKIKERLEGRRVKDMKHDSMTMLLKLCNSKNIAALAVKRNCQLIAPGIRIEPIKAKEFQNSSLFAHFYRATPLDLGIVRREERFVMTLANSLFEKNPKVMGRMISDLREDMTRDADLISNIMKKFLKVGPESMNLVLIWFSAAIQLNQGRTHSSHFSNRIEDAAETLNPMVALDEFQAVVMELPLGLGLQIFWGLLELCNPIQLDKVSDIDPFFVFSSDVCENGFLGDLPKDAKLGDEDAVKAAQEFYRKSRDSSADPKFITRIFWLTLRALSVLFRPAFNEFIKLLRGYDTAVASLRSGTSAQSPDDPSVIGLKEFYCYTLVFLHPKFLHSLIHFLNLAISFFFHNMYCFEADGSPSSSANEFLKKHNGSLMALAERSCVALTQGVDHLSLTSSNRTSVVPPQFSVIPASMLDDLLNAVQRMGILHVASNLFPEESNIDPGVLLNFPLISSAFFVVTLETSFFRNVHTRYEGGVGSFHMFQNIPSLRHNIENTSILKKCGIVAFVVAFIDTQKAQYYDRIRFRLVITEVFENLLRDNTYQDELNTLSKKQPAVFIPFIHLVLNDVSELVEDAMNFVSEVRRRELAGTNIASPGDSASASSQADNPNYPTAGQPQDQDEGSEQEDGAEALLGGTRRRDLSFSSLKEITGKVVSLGYKMCVLLWTCAKYCGETIINASALLPHAIACLDCCLDHLVGPKCMRLKIANMHEYNFNPKDWLCKVCETFVFLADTENGDKVVQEIVHEGRFYNSTSFKKALQIARREGIMASKVIEKFAGLYQKLMEFEDDQGLMDDVDIPEQFFDPIMQEMMLDPVQLPTSGVIMDRRHIERHLMSEPTDPFNRAPLSPSELVSLPELRKEIQAFVVEMKEKKRLSQLEASGESTKES